MTKPSNAIMTVLILMFLASIFAIQLVVEKRIGPRVDIYRDDQRDHLRDYLVDAAIVAKDPVFARPETEKADAGPYLNPRLRWSPLPEGTRPQAKDVLEFPDEWRIDVMGDRGRWMRLYFRYNPKKVDFRIFTELRKYDHWRLDENSPIADLMERKKYPNSVGIPLPDLTDLTILARLYCMHALATDQALSALEDLRHLARLLLSTEHVETEMAGIALLKTERHAYNYFVRHGYVEEDEWTPVSEETVLRAQRVYMAERVFLHLWSTEIVLKTVFVDHEAPALCATVNDAISDDWSLSGMLRPRLWPEDDLGPAYERLGSIVESAASHGCRLTFIREKITKDRWPSESDVPWYALHTPFVRRLFALDYATLPPTGFNLSPSTDSN